MAKLKQQLDEKTAAISLGLLFAVLHFAGTLVLFAGGQGLLDWFHAIHFISVQETLIAFDPMVLVIGTVAAFVGGAIVGGLFAAIWNRVAKK